MGPFDWFQFHKQSVHTVAKISSFLIHHFNCATFVRAIPVLLAPSIAGEPRGSQTPGLVVLWFLLDGGRLDALIIVQAIYHNFYYLNTVGNLSVTCLCH